MSSSNEEEEGKIYRKTFLIQMTARVNKRERERERVKREGECARESQGE